SNTTDPTQGFHGMKFSAASNFGDFDTLGVNADGLYLSTNNFPLNAGATTPPTNTTIVSIPMADRLLPTPSVAKPTQFSAQSLNTAQCINIGGRAGIQWYKINESNGALLQTGTIADANFDFIDPSIATNPNGDVVIGYSRTSASTFVGAYASVGTTSGGVTTF